MHIPKIINNLPKQISFLTRKRIFGDELEEYKTYDELLIEKTQKQIKKASKILKVIEQKNEQIYKVHGLKIQNNDTEKYTELVVNNFRQNVSSKLYLKPKNVSSQKWFIILSAAKHSSGLKGIPYEWIENRGKLKIHRIAFQYTENKNKKKESIF